MPARPLPTQSLLELIGWFERSNQLVSDAQGQSVAGIPGWDLFARSSLPREVLSAWMHCTGYAGMYPAPLGDETVAVELQEDQNPDRYSYRCPETFRTKFVAASAVGIYGVDPSKFLNQIATLLDIPLALRRDIEAPAIDDVLWHLGRARIGAAHVDVWFVRELAARTTEVLQYFHAPALPDHGLILSSGQALPAVVQATRRYRVVSLAEVLVQRPGPPVLDVDLLHRLMTAPIGQSPAKSLPVRFDLYSNTLVIATKSNRPWAIKGKRQVAMVQHLFEQAQNDRWWVPAHEILTAVYGPKKSGRSQRIQSIFSGNLVWQDYIGSDGKGQYGFLLD